MRILMIAPPGAGKGTQGALIAAHFNIPHIATGELLRDHVARGTALGQAVRAYLDRGELVPDQIVLDMVREAMIAAKAAGGGYVLDGIPRNMEQARRERFELGPREWFVRTRRRLLGHETGSNHCLQLSLCPRGCRFGGGDRRPREERDEHADRRKEAAAHTPFLSAALRMALIQANGPRNQP